MPSLVKRANGKPVRLVQMIQPPLFQDVWSFLISQGEEGLGKDFHILYPVFYSADLSALDRPYSQEALRRLLDQLWQKASETQQARFAEKSGSDQLRFTLVEPDFDLWFKFFKASFLFEAAFQGLYVDSEPDEERYLELMRQAFLLDIELTDLHSAWARQRVQKLSQEKPEALVHVLLNPIYGGLPEDWQNITPQSLYQSLFLFFKRHPSGKASPEEIRRQSLLYFLGKAISGDPELREGYESIARRTKAQLSYERWVEILLERLTKGQIDLLNEAIREEWAAYWEAGDAQPSDFARVARRAFFSLSDEGKLPPELWKKLRELLDEFRKIQEKKPKPPARKGPGYPDATHSQAPKHLPRNISLAARARAAGLEERPEELQKITITKSGKLVDKTFNQLKEELVSAAKSVSRPGWNVNLQKALRLAQGINPNFGEEFKKSQIQSASWSVVANFVIRAVNEVFLPSDYLFTIHFAQGSQEVVAPEPKSFFARILKWKRRGEYLGTSVWEADIEWFEYPGAAGMSFGPYSFIDRKSAQAGARKMFQYIMQEKELPETLVGVFKRKWNEIGLKEDNYAYYFGELRYRFEEACHAMDDIYLKRKTGKEKPLFGREEDLMEILRALLKQDSPLLKDPEDSTQPVKPSVYYLAVVEELSAQLGGIISEMNYYLQMAEKDPSWKDLAYLAFIDFVLTKLGEAKLGETSSVLEPSFQAARLLADVFEMNRLTLENVSLLQEIERASQASEAHPAKGALAVLREIYNVHFFDVAERAKDLSGLEEAQKTLEILGEAAQGPGVVVVEDDGLQGAWLQRFLGMLPEPLARRVVVFDVGKTGLEELAVTLVGMPRADRITYLGEASNAGRLQRLLPASMTVIPKDLASGLEEILLALGVAQGVLNQVDLGGLEEVLARERGA